MCIITVADDDYISGREFAQTLASRLGFRFVDAGILVERAAAWGGEREKLHRTCEQAPRFYDRFMRSKYVQVLQLQAALAPDIREGNVVCYGVAADLLSIKGIQIVRVRIKASYGSRLLLVQQRMRFSAAEARTCLHKGERRRKRWRRYLSAARPDGSGLLINLDEAGVDQACATIRDMTERQAGFQPTNPDQGTIEKWALCAAIRAAVAQHPKTRHLDIDVTTEGDSIVLCGTAPLAINETTFPLRLPANMSLSIQAALAEHPETKDLHPEVTIDGDALVLRGIVLGPHKVAAPQPLPAYVEAGSSRLPAGVSDHQSGFFFGQRLLERTGGPWRLLAGGRFLLRRAAVAAASGVIVIAALIYGGIWGRMKWQQTSGAPLLSFAGVITDSSCGASHKAGQLSADCVRSCVRSGGAKYALSESGHIIIISNQQAAERFAARRVVVRGRLDERSGELHIATIRIAAL